VHTDTYNYRTSSRGEVSSGTTPFAGIAAANNGEVVNSTDLGGGHSHTVSGTTSDDTHNHTLTTTTDGAFTPAGTIGATGGTSNASETRPRNVAVQFLIKF
jgi:hypothetical protein